MKCAQFEWCILLLVVLVFSADGKKSFSSRRKSGGSSSRRGSSTGSSHNPQPAPINPHRSDTVNTPFLNSERSGTVNQHYRGSPFSNKPSAPEAPKNVPHTNGPIGFEGLNNQGSQKIGFGNAQNKPNVPSAPAYPAKPAANAPNGPPPAYPGYGAPGAHAGSYEPPPAYPGRPVNAPPVYTPNNPSFPQKAPGQPGMGGYPNQQGGFQQNSYQQSPYPQQQGVHPGQSYPGQQSFGYPNTGSNFGEYPSQGYNQQGFGGSYPSGGFGSSYPGGIGQPHSGFGGNPYGGSPFGQSPFGGSPMSSGGFGGNNHYSPNNFGFSNSPGLFGSNSPYPGYSGNYNNYGYHKKSRFGGLPIPIPIPIPIPFGGFGGFGGRSHNHRVLDTFVKDKNISDSDNATTSIFILNNTTVTPCTTDQFIYDSLNVTVMSCTAGNCTAIKVFVTTYGSSQSSVHSAAITLCLEPNATFSTHSDNVVPTVSEVHEYWMKVCKESIESGNVTEDGPANVTVKITEIPAVNITEFSELPSVNVTEVSETNVTMMEQTELPPTVESSTLSSTVAPTEGIFNISESISSLSNSTEANSSCEIFDCSWIEMCLPSVDMVDRCETPGCAFTRTGYQPCVKIKMCKSPTTPISTFATLNTTISRIGEFNNVTSVHDVANLTLISYIPLTSPTNCSQNATDPSCLQPPELSFPQDACSPSNSSEVTDGAPLVVNNSTLCRLPEVPESNSTAASPVDTTIITSEATTTPIR